jgi:hypothetical protein
MTGPRPRFAWLGGRAPWIMRGTGHDAVPGISVRSPWEPVA